MYVTAWSQTLSLFNVALEINRLVEVVCAQIPLPHSTYWNHKKNGPMSCPLLTPPTISQTRTYLPSTAYGTNAPTPNYYSISTLIYLAFRPLSWILLRFPLTPTFEANASRNAAAASLRMRVMSRQTRISLHAPAELLGRLKRKRWNWPRISGYMMNCGG